MFASDPALAATIAKMVDDGKTGERAVLEGFGQVEEMFRQIGGYQGERAADLHDVGQRATARPANAPCSKASARSRRCSARSAAIRVNAPPTCTTWASA